jgi:Ca2+-binding EF-hand superfamily protein
LKELKIAFEQMDVNRDGNISVEELRNGLEKIQFLNLLENDG